MKKRGQVTIFIIIGIIILLLTTIFILYRNQVTIFKPEIIIPTEVEPVKNYIEDCIYVTAEEGIRLLGANGGFIRFPDSIDNDPSASITTNPFFKDIKTPLWRYRGQTRIPSEAQMIADLEYYIEENLNTCMLDLEPFQALFSIEKGNTSVKVELIDDGVLVELNYPLKLVLGQKNQTTTINQFTSLVPLRLKHIYELAKQIMQEENNDMFIEDTAIDLIALDPDIPYTDLEFTCQQKVWYVEEVRDKLKHLLRTDLPLIRVDQTEYEPVPLNRPYEAAHYIWEVTSLKYPSTHVSFSYDEKWPFEFYVRPNHGPILKSNAQQGQELLSFLCIHLWHFTYDARFPVLVTITDEPGKKYDGFTFNFGFEAGISRNRPDKTNFGITTFDFEQPSSDDERFCKESQKNILTVHTFENVSTDDYGDLTEEIDKVDITYTCLRLKCPIGQTEWSFGGAVSILSKEFPYCVNGILKGTKEDYKDSQIFVTTNEEKTVDLYLTPIINKNFTVVKHYQYSNLLEEELDKDETAIITLKRKNTSFTSAIYPTIEENAGLELLAKWDYTYDLEIYLADDAGIIGGYKAEWTPSWDMMKNTNEIKFHVIEWPYTEDQAEQYQFLAQLETQSQSVPKPELR